LSNIFFLLWKTTTW